MKKEKLLQELYTKISTGEISREEVIKKLNLATTTQQMSNEETNRFPHFSLTKMLYFLGATIVIIGIIIFVTQIWDNIGSFNRVMVTLGLGLLITAIGSVLLKQKPEDNIGPVFHCIGGVLIPIGSVVTLSELANPSVYSVSPWPIAITFGVIFIFYLLLNAVHKHPILTFLAITNGTAFTYLLTEAIFDKLYYNHDIYAYLTMAIGATYLLIAHDFRDGFNKNLIGILYFFGITSFLGAAFSQVFDSILWQLFYFILVSGGLLLSVYMKSRSILVISTLFLIGHVSYITAEYFTDSLGWPISLVILGFLFIGFGYASVTINKKYIKIVQISLFDCFL